MLSLLCMLNVYQTYTAVTQTTETKSSRAAVEDEVKTNWRSDNSPLLCLLALESLRTSLWPMELRKTIASATSPSCIVPVAFQAMQGPPLQPDGSGGGSPFLCGTGGSLYCWDWRSLVSPVVPLSLRWCQPVPPLSLSVSFTLAANEFVSLCSGVWCCGCESKQAQGTTRHHTGGGGGGGKGNEESGAVGWKGKHSDVRRIKRRRLLNF